MNEHNAEPPVWMPLLGTVGLAIRSSLLNERQAMANHGQTLARLAERGGLGPSEALAIVERRKWRNTGSAGETGLLLLEAIAAAAPKAAPVKPEAVPADWNLIRAEARALAAGTGRSIAGLLSAVDAALSTQAAAPATKTENYCGIQQEVSQRETDHGTPYQIARWTCPNCGKACSNLYLDNEWCHGDSLSISFGPEKDADGTWTRHHKCGACWLNKSEAAGAAAPVGEALRVWRNNVLDLIARHFPHVPMSEPGDKSRALFTAFAKEVAALGSPAGGVAHGTDKALEFAEYMAKSAEQYLTAVNAEDMAHNAWKNCTEPAHRPLEWDKYHAAEFERCEFANRLRSRIYEFRKRAAKVPGGVEQPFHGDEAGSLRLRAVVPTTNAEEGPK